MEQKTRCVGYECGASRMRDLLQQRRLTRSKDVTVAPVVGQQTTLTVHSAYLGPVPLSCTDLGRGYVALYSSVKTSDGKQLYVKEIDATLHRLDYRLNYSLKYLNLLQPSVVNIQECKRNYDIIQTLRAKTVLTATEKAQLHQALIHNNVVDIHFQTCLYVEFLQNVVGVNNIIASNVLISWHNVKRLDNAYFSGQYMVYGNGDSMFLPMGTLDITGHELGHGVVQLLSGLIYEGHAGALNESFADCLGVTFEFYAYKRFPTLQGKPDWLMGEDNGKAVAFLRNIQDPTNAQYPQPKIYRGQYWADPNSQADYGGVHQNSGVANWCFYNCCLSTDLDRTIATFLRCLRKLQPISSYVDFRNNLQLAAQEEDKPKIEGALNTCGLTKDIVSDWQKKAVALSKKRKMVQ